MVNFQGSLHVIWKGGKVCRAIFTASELRSSDRCISKYQNSLGVKFLIVEHGVKVFDVAPRLSIRLIGSSMHQVRSKRWCNGKLQ